MKALKIAAICLVVIFVAGALVFALGVPVGFLMKPIGDRVEAATGYRLRAAGDTRLTFWPVLTLSSRDVSIDRDGEPDSGFSAQSIQVSLTPASVFSGRPDAQCFDFRCNANASISQACVRRDNRAANRPRGRRAS
jgi:uncharacterized protein involved in outer membrane biogenesis